MVTAHDLGGIYVKHAYYYWPAYTLSVGARLVTVIGVCLSSLTVVFCLSSSVTLAYAT